VKRGPRAAARWDTWSRIRFPQGPVRADHALGVGVLPRCCAPRRGAGLHGGRCPPARSWSPPRPQYAEYAFKPARTPRVLALVLEAIREPGRLRAVPGPRRGGAAIPVVMLTAGRSAGGRAPGVRPLGGRWPPRTAAGRRWPARVRRAPRRRPGRDGRHTLELFALHRKTPALKAARAPRQPPTHHPTTLPAPRRPAPPAHPPPQPAGPTTAQPPRPPPPPAAGPTTASSPATSPPSRRAPRPPARQGSALRPPAPTNHIPQKKPSSHINFVNSQRSHGHRDRA